MVDPGNGSEDKLSLATRDARRRLDEVSAGKPPEHDADGLGDPFVCLPPLRSVAKTNRKTDAVGMNSNISYNYRETLTDHTPTVFYFHARAERNDEKRKARDTQPCIRF